VLPVMKPLAIAATALVASAAGAEPQDIPSSTISAKVYSVVRNAVERSGATVRDRPSKGRLLLGMTISPIRPPKPSDLLEPSCSYSESWSLRSKERPSESAALLIVTICTEKELTGALLSDAAERQKQTAARLRELSASQVVLFGEPPRKIKREPAGEIDYLTVIIMSEGGIAVMPTVVLSDGSKHVVTQVFSTSGAVCALQTPPEECVDPYDLLLSIAEQVAKLPNATP